MLECASLAWVLGETNQAVLDGLRLIFLNWMNNVFLVSCKVVMQHAHFLLEQNFE